jgi:hypothetical protein
VAAPTRGAGALSCPYKDDQQVYRVSAVNLLVKRNTYFLKASFTFSPASFRLDLA